MNSLNKYTGINTENTENAEEGNSVNSVFSVFNPSYDADGNATLVQTSTGAWSITYNGENRPVRFENAATQTVVDCAYDSQGRRFEKKVTVAGTTTLHHRYIYRGYLQIAALDLTRAAHPALWFVTWDPTPPVATRPLAIQKDGTWFTYGYDLTKNICEVFGPAGYIRTAYSYAPFGAVTESGDVSQPFQWSSEVYDSELDLVYYNFRHYSPSLGRFLSRDPIEEQGGLNLYAFVGNSSTLMVDILGMVSPGYDITRLIDEYFRLQEERRIDNSQAHKYCDNYQRNKGAKCCRDGKLVADTYVDDATAMCHKFVEMYSHDGKVLLSVDCVAKCLSESEDDHMKISNCSDRNAQRLARHVTCYASCGFLLVDRYNIGTPDGGWEMGFEKMLPDFFESMKNWITDLFSRKNTR